MPTDKLRSLITDIILAGRQVEFADDDDLFSGKILDSLDMVQLVSLLEDTFAFKIQVSELIPDNFNSIAKMSAYVGRKLAKA
jgi:acyl carrier protein